jgi:hypothetical protein
MQSSTVGSLRRKGIDRRGERWHSWDMKIILAFVLTTVAFVAVVEVLGRLFRK